MSNQQIGVFQARPRSAACTEERLRQRNRPVSNAAGLSGLF
jgi:hypothetical protein